jgi:hypothetical protein
LALLAPEAAASYEAAVAAVAPTIERSLSESVVGNRVAEASGVGLRLEAWGPARRRFLSEVQRRSHACGAMLVADVRRCYSSITPATVVERLGTLGCPHPHVARVERELRSLAAHGVRGLPIGPEPSAVLANAVLGAADDAVTQEGAAHLRWVDDFVMFAEDAEHAASVLERLHEALAQLGLVLSTMKTGILESPRAVGAWMSGGCDPGVDARYHPRADAYPLPCRHGSYQRAPADGGVDPG